ncbi:hypothetical protein A2Z67_05895 [Candidatus Woesebacteria bacterium RBG_13_36_22]|uniref:Resolvase HTH domain-containing protein n=1 Tax=Candidatus Woesebacteria bacterium RBG_13_36_22 TaxID=1802478 RepID=A0A1F7X1Z8_9BACT|nr:MAG: hypothetical protein A2Z67_05895 [Candidatus Woesebacteria bacterium RBG_13_36_22]
MGYFGKIEEKQRAIKLRNRGLSYSEIQETVKVSKDTLSRWCRDVLLSLEQIERLQKRKLQGAERGRVIGAKRQQERRLKEIKFFIDKGKKDIGNLNKRDRFLVGISLYAAEGGKRDSSIEFSNSDPKIIKFIIKWFREFCNIPEEKFRGAIWIHDNLDPDNAKIFWSKMTNIPENQFHKTYIAKNKKDSNKIRKNIHKFGVFSIRVSSTKAQRMILGWIAGILAS